MDFDVLVANAMRSCLFCCEYDILIFMSIIFDCNTYLLAIVRREFFTGIKLILSA